MMIKSLRSWGVFVGVALITAGGLIAFTHRVQIAEALRERFTSETPLPPARPWKEVAAGITPTPTPSASPNSALPAIMNLDVPFTSQAPEANWELPFKEACEEASLLMVDAFYKAKTFTKASATAVILELVEFEKTHLGHYEDTNAAETADVARAYFGYKNVRLVPGPITADMIKREIAAGRPVIIPAAGRLLGNPNYTPPGPYYHMLVIKGYTTTEFITNDPGTRKGADFRYSYATVLNAIHDYAPENITEMSQVMIVIAPK